MGEVYRARERLSARQDATNAALGGSWMSNLP
jgi:hypothetical protein